MDLRRFPSADDALSWPELLTRYDISDASRALLILRRTDHPRTYTLSPLFQKKVGFDTVVQVPAIDNGPIWVQITVQSTRAGKALSLVYKDPAVFMSVSTRDGQQKMYRLIPGQAQAGFLLSPVVGDHHAFAALASPQWRERLSGKQVTSIRMSKSGWVGTNWAYCPDLYISFYLLRIPSQPIDLKSLPPGSR